MTEGEIRKTVVVDAPPEVVFKALTDEKELVRWMPQEARMDPRLGGEYDSVIDSGLFHSLMDEERPVYARQIDWVLRDGGIYYMLCFSEKEREFSGPRRISKQEIEKTFSRLFRINYIRDTIFGGTFHHKGAKGYITCATKEKS